MNLVGHAFELVKLLLDPIMKQINYVKDAKKNVQTLRTKVDGLAIRERDIRAKVHMAELQGKRPTYEVESWLGAVEEVSKETCAVEQVLEEDKSCFWGHTFILCSRRKLGKRISKLNQVVDTLKEKNFVMDDLVVDQFPPAIRSFPTTTLIGKSSAEKTLEIWENILDVKVGRIGVYGMGGIGKTTIMKHVHNRIKKDQVFDTTIWVTVSKASSLKILQHKILNKFDLKFKDEEESQYLSSRLFEVLSQCGKYVLILDDMWCPFQLEEVGIPEPNETNGCKLILTTRSLGVCRGMETQNDVKVNMLSNEEAWDLFRDKAGDVVLLPQVKPLAEFVAKECRGLPLAIIAVGRALRNVNDVSLWRNALNELKYSTFDIVGTEHDIFVHLKFSYDYLRSDTIRACFLYCALFPEDFVISKPQLIQYWIWEGLLGEDGDKEAANDKGQAILNELKDACLLESANDYYVVDGVKMHDMIRDMAIDITRVKPRFMVKAGLGLNDESWKGEEWADVERISLMRNNFQVLPDEPISLRLSTLFLQANPGLKDIPPLFFKNMDKLRVIELAGTKIESIPDSLSNMENLTALLVGGCKRLKRVPSLAKLKRLMALYLWGTAIEEVPQGMEFLVNLRSLDLSNTPNLLTFPAGVLTNLTHLEIISMYHSGWRWSTTPTKGGGSIDEIIHSSKLAALYLSFLDFHSFNRYVRSGHWKKLTRFYFMIGSVKDQPFFVKDNIVEIDGQGLDCSNLELPDKTHALFIQRCHNEVICSQFSKLSYLLELKVCRISKCKRVEFIMIDEVSLPNLEELKLVDLPDLRAVCKEPGQCFSFESLKILEIGWCDNLTRLFSVKQFQQLQNLEEFTVWRCNQMEEMLVEDEPMDEPGNYAAKIKLPRLKSMRLHDMQKLEIICKRVISFDTLQSIRVSACPKLKKLPISIDELPGLEEIKGSREWWDALEWDNPNAKTYLQAFLKEES